MPLQQTVAYNLIISCVMNVSQQQRICNLIKAKKEMFVKFRLFLVLVNEVNVLVKRCDEN